MNYKNSVVQKGLEGFERTGDYRRGIAGEFAEGLDGNVWRAETINGARNILRRRLTSRFVNVVTSRSIWVTLPGDNESHKLTEDDARTLFRQLEEVV